MVSRMVGMKGFDLVQSVADGLVDRGIELVILGSGESQYENFFSDLCGRHPGRVGTYIGFEPALSQEIYAGADAFIMPSKSEPCGLAQMVACRYGTPPIIRETGGLRDSIHDCTLGEGNGFTFAGYSATSCTMPAAAHRTATTARKTGTTLSGTTWSATSAGMSPPRAMRPLQ